MWNLFLFSLLALPPSFVIASEVEPYVESYHSPRNPLEKRQAQYIINPCPEFFKDNPPQYCSDSRCGGDTVKRGVW